MTGAQNIAARAPDRLIAFGGVLPGTVPDPGAEVDRLAKTRDSRD